MLTGRPGGTRARAAERFIRIHTRSDRANTRHYPTLYRPGTAIQSHRTMSCVALAFVRAGNYSPADSYSYTYSTLPSNVMRGCALVTLRVTHLVYLVPVTKISTRTAVRIAGTTLFTTRRCDTKAGERTPPQTRNATPHNFCAIFGLYLSCIARAFGDCQ